MRSAWATVALVVLVFLSTARSLENGFAFDDVPIILENPQVHDLAPPWDYAQQSYWPPRNLGDAYRPLTIWGFALQWRASGGTAFLFHAVNLGLAVAAVLAVFALAAAVLPFQAAWLAAALFAVHPVHVEATGNIVGQAEMWMTVFVCLGVWLHIRGATGDGRTTAAGRLAIAACLVLGAAAKEQGIVLPGLLVAADFFLLSSPGSRRARIRAAAPTYLLLAVFGFGFLLCRYLVLGDLGGGPPAKGLEGLGLGGRTTAMLPIVLEWVRLLIWPRALAAQYSPPGYAGSAQWTGAATLGLLVVAGSIALAIAVRRRAPAISFGLAWIGIALLPVGNVFFPTGIVVAERTLFLPTVGVVLAAGGAIAMVRDSIVRWVVASAAIVLLGLGIARSYSRQAVWHDNTTLFAQTVIDGPTSYRSFYVHGRELARRRRSEDAKDAFERAASLYAGDPRVFDEWGQIFRSDGDCTTAAVIFARGVAADPTGTVSRSRLVECLIKTGRFAEAKHVADAGLAMGHSEFGPASARAARALDSVARR